VEVREGFMKIVKLVARIYGGVLFIARMISSQS
jgi:hypothetical protein